MPKLLMLFEQKEIEMINYLLKRIVMPLSLVLVLVGCGGSDSSSSIVLGETYDEKDGDVFTMSYVLDVIYSNDQTFKDNFENVETYLQVSEIPSKYGYSNSITGPYLLKVTQNDGVIDMLDYMSNSGESIIDDDLDYYTNIEYTTSTGIEEPENVSIGDKFNYNQNSILFDSQTGAEAGYEIIDVQLSIINTEPISIPAGDFNAVKMNYSFLYTTSINNVVDTFTSTGYMMIDTAKGYLLQMILEGEMTLNELDLTAILTSKVTLKNYYISPNVTGKNGEIRNSKDTLSNLDLDTDVLFEALTMNIHYIRSRQLLH